MDGTENKYLVDVRKYLKGRKSKRSLEESVFYRQLKFRFKVCVKKLPIQNVLADMTKKIWTARTEDVDYVRNLRRWRDLVQIMADLRCFDSHKPRELKSIFDGLV